MNGSLTFELVFEVILHDLYSTPTAGKSHGTYSHHRVGIHTRMTWARVDVQPHQLAEIRFFVEQRHLQRSFHSPHESSPLASGGHYFRAKNYSGMGPSEKA